jgi:uncharacterized protein YceH (UPF0502 family)
MNADDIPSELPLLNAVEARVLGCLIEKKETTPDVYPLTPNAAHAAANQKTARDPIMSLGPVEVHRALNQLEQKGLARHAFSSRAERYEHRVQQQLGLSPQQVALLGLLILRGPQTAYELLARSERMSSLGSVEEVREHLESLIQRQPALAALLARQPGQREERYAHLLCGPVVEATPAASRAYAQPASAELEARVQALEEQVAKLMAEVEGLTTRNPSQG